MNNRTSFILMMFICLFPDLINQLICQINRNSMIDLNPLYAS